MQEDASFARVWIFNKGANTGKAKKKKKGFPVYLFFFKQAVSGQLDVYWRCNEESEGAFPKFSPTLEAPGWREGQH